MTAPAATSRTETATWVRDGEKTVAFSSSSATACISPSTAGATAYSVCPPCTSTRPNSTIRDWAPRTQSKSVTGRVSRRGRPDPAHHQQGLGLAGHLGGGVVGLHHLGHQPRVGHMLLQAVEHLLLDGRHGVHVPRHGLEGRLYGVAQHPLAAGRLVQLLPYGRQPGDLLGALGGARPFPLGGRAFLIGDGPFPIRSRPGLADGGAQSGDPQQPQEQHQRQNDGQGHDDGHRPRQHL